MPTSILCLGYWKGQQFYVLSRWKAFEFVIWEPSPYLAFLYFYYLKLLFAMRPFKVTTSVITTWRDRHDGEPLSGLRGTFECGISALYLYHSLSSFVIYYLFHSFIVCYLLFIIFFCYLLFLIFIYLLFISFIFICYLLFRIFIYYLLFIIFIIISYFLFIIYHLHLYFLSSCVSLLNVPKNALK